MSHPKWHRIGLPAGGVRLSSCSAFQQQQQTQQAMEAALNTDHPVGEDQKWGKKEKKATIGCCVAAKGRTYRELIGGRTWSDGGCGCWLKID